MTDLQISCHTKYMDPRTAAALARRSSGAAGAHKDKRTARNRDRSTNRRNSINDQKESS